MRKILFITFFILTYQVSHSQGSLEIDSLTNNDSIVNATSKLGSRNLVISKSLADSAYIRNDFTTAIQIYEMILRTGESADIYYNLGNSYYKIGDIAKAILNYERALILKPANKDIRSNLEIARAKTVDKVTDVPELFFITWLKSITNSMGIQSWAIIAISFFLLFIVSIYIFFFSTKIVARKTFFILALFFLVFCVIANISAAFQRRVRLNRMNAIIISPSVTIRSTPNDNGTSLFILHEGRKVFIKDDSMKDWKEIQLEDGNVGWVKKNDLEVI
ncbi:MAG: tetratricopeptide repeat protein [Bacteroides graminisolvens]|jgi:tetratricopeptide (TPR) repeat protein|uniref:tetratricopeptide repeat protein n=1 Tax=Bacteroides graminisolvens TaxID=477666 RepID=UPI00040515C7|nr:tetratricopeptide repeat protein [Bacteroides graminisolvens]MEA4885397.1 tetratricopeptide repeat protein [Bacteroides graminisolvens]NBK97156.1 tetratricopeptide repeat protein [Erysipelotrichia bacterium]